MRLILDAYSGLQDPYVDIPASLALPLLGVFGDNGMFAGGTAREMPNRLGYRGITLVLPAALAGRFNLTPYINFPALNPISHLRLLIDLHDVLKAAVFAGFSLLDWILKRIKAIIAWLSTPAPKGTGSGSSITACKFETVPYDPDTWNNSPFVKTNNCYAYAANKLSNYSSKPQPGAATGKQYVDPPTGPDVAAAAKRDGAHEVNDCFADSEAPRGLVALVIWPGEDYHWYRKHPDFWGHKRGGTPVQNLDFSSKVITDPATCDRGPYTIFHGYLLMPKSQQVAV